MVPSAGRCPVDCRERGKRGIEFLFSKIPGYVSFQFPADFKLEYDRECLPLRTFQLSTTTTNNARSLGARSKGKIGTYIA
jgi:hypothetical protein